MGVKAAGLMGLSPLVRGKLNNYDSFPITEGSIPACAGETHGAIWLMCNVRVYPRLCGGNCAVIVSAFSEMGLSPLVRGKQMRILEDLAFHGSIPACAGETTAKRQKLAAKWVYPRLCGGNVTIKDRCRNL